MGYQYPDLAADELDYLLLSGSDRIGALDFQASATEYVPRESDHPTLDDLLQATELLEASRPLPLNWSMPYCTAPVSAAPDLRH